MIKLIEKITEAEIFVPVKTEERFDYELILLHHTATVADFKTLDGLYAEEIDYIHRNGKREGYPPFRNGMGYHFLVNPDGRIEIGDRWIEQLYGAHCPGHNHTSLGVCMVGNFSRVLPTDPQIDSLGKLLAALRPVKIMPHRAYRQTECPGMNITLEYWYKHISPLIRGEVDNRALDRSFVSAMRKTGDDRPQLIEPVEILGDVRDETAEENDPSDEKNNQTR